MSIGTEEEIERQIEGLFADDRYRRLMLIKPVFDLFDFLGGLGENASSRALAFLLDSTREHGLGTRFLHSLLRQVHFESRNAASRLSLLKLLKLQGEESTTKLEWATSAGRRADILVHVFDRNGQFTAVIGIENKHWAAEQHDQVAHYQRELLAHFPAVEKVLLFLAPGR